MQGSDIQTGSHWIRLTEDPLNVAQLLPFLQVPEAGGIDIFIGTTRRWTNGEETVALDYDAYAPMAVKELERLMRLAEEKWPVERCGIWHRIGVVPVAEASVIIGVASAHRAEAFEACRFLIDRLKEDVPIWKCDESGQGKRQWVDSMRSNN